MIGVFIPSYNRACQLYALLESIKKYDQCSLLKNIHVRWAATSDLQNQAYQRLINSPIAEGVDIKPKCGEALSQDMFGIMKKESYDFFCFITDDSLFYRPFCIKLEDFYDFMRSDVNHLSFRLGFNTTVVNYVDPSYKEELHDYKQVGPFIKFPWIYHQNHFGFPCAIDGSIWWREYILREIKECCGENFDYRYMECRLHEHLKIFSKRHQGLCLPDSVLVNVPANMVASGPYCRNGELYKFTIDELAEKFISGEKIDIASIDSSTIVSVQQEIPFKFCSQNE